MRIPESLEAGKSLVTGNASKFAGKAEGNEGAGKAASNGSPPLPPIALRAAVSEPTAALTAPVAALFAAGKTAVPSPLKPSVKPSEKPELFPEKGRVN